MSPTNINSLIQDQAQAAISAATIPNSTTTDDNLRQHAALANLFKSLSNLASGGQHHPQQLPQQQQPLSLISEHLPSVDTSNRAHSFISTTTLASTSDNADAKKIATSLQSVVAAAVMQRQLVNVAMNQNQQHSQPVLFPHQTTNSMRAQVTSGQPLQMPASQRQPLPPQQTSINSLAFSSNQLSTAYAFLDQLPGQAHEPDLDVQLSSQSALNNQSNLNQRINYCTICNKELCNKYFMKTHMLKMHGINLEMEQSICESNDVDNGNNDANSVNGDDSSNRDSADDCSQSAKNTWSAEQSQTLLKDRQQGKSSIQSSSKSTQSNSQNTKTNSPNKQATSVLNGFAGNSMGGVVCDICNKELCSKYFLKVHKQNTHGIMTEYQDAGQFVYPFVNPLTGSNPFLPIGTVPLNPLTGPATTNALAFNGTSLNYHQGDQSNSVSKSSGSKRARLDHSKSEVGPISGLTPKDESLIATSTASMDKYPFDPLYRLMAAQQQPATPAATFDKIAASQMSAMMCFGAMSPFGPSAGISPTMVVELILRNQHLFDRKTNNNRSMLDKNRDKNNNDSKQKVFSKNSKESNNSRYFTHYTEACPMCDRRFKSIKWLKTHMMNDHKQEIGAYMQMMIQNFCPTKNQQQAAASHMSESNSCYPMNFACNQMAQNQHQHLPDYQQSQSQPPTSLMSSTSNNQPFDQTGQLNIIQTYLDQQRQALLHKQNQQQHHHQIQLQLQQQQQHHHQQLQQQQMFNMCLESNQTPILKLGSPLVNPSNTQETLIISSSSSTAKTATSPQSHTGEPSIGQDEQQNNQLDLSLKFNHSINQSDCSSEVGTEYAVRQKDSLDCNQTCETQNYSDEDSSTRSSFGREEVLKDNVGNSALKSRVEATSGSN